MLKKNTRVANGDFLEGELDKFHVTLSSKGWYVHPKAPRGATNVKKPPDYLLGSPSGKFVMFDAKSVKKSDWYVSLLKPHQFADLNAFTGEAGIYLRTKEGDAWLPFQALVRPLWLRHFKGGESCSLRHSDGLPIVGMDWTVHVGR